MSTVSRGSLAAAITLALGVSHAHATNFDVTNTDDSGAGSLRQALIDAAGDSNIPHTINLAAIAGQTINTTSTLSFSTASVMDLTITGSDVTVAGDGSAGVFEFNSSYYYDLDVTITDLTVTGGEGYYGGGILFDSESKYTAGSLTLDNVTVTGNTAVDAGGGIAVAGAALSLNNSTITNNSANSGGGVFHVGSSLSVSNSTISDNSIAGGYGGPLSQRFALPDRLAQRGLGGGIGGGIFSVSDDGSSITDSTISGNNADGYFGGALLVAEEGVNIQRSTFTGNTASGGMGGLYAASYFGQVQVESTTISGNSAEYIGGALIGSYYGSTRIHNSTISGNSASEDVGGLVAVGSYSPPEISFSTIVNNSAGIGVGGVVMLGGSYYRGLGYDPRVNTSIIAGNLSDGEPSDLDSGSSLSPRDFLGSEAGTRGGGGGGNIAVDYTLLGSTSPSLTLDAVSLDLLGQNPLLGPLANNGGPTMTHLPGVGSPALNVVPVGTFGCGTSVTEDQRGQGRPQDTACTLGSVDTQGVVMAPPMPVPIGNSIGMLLMAGLMGLAGMLGLRRRRNTLG